MIDQYYSLKALSNIVENTLYPTLYKCTPREMILCSSVGWEQITTHLTQLESESLVEISHGLAPLFNITEKILKKICVLELRP